MKGGIFTGERWEAYSQLLFLRARYYEPATGRFFTRDQWPGDPFWPQTSHGYSYALNNAVNVTDPSGQVSAHIVTQIAFAYKYDLWPTYAIPGTGPTMPPWAQSLGWLWQWKVDLIDELVPEFYEVESVQSARAPGHGVQQILRYQAALNAANARGWSNWMPGTRAAGPLQLPLDPINDVVAELEEPGLIVYRIEPNLKRALVEAEVVCLSWLAYQIQKLGHVLQGLEVLPSIPSPVLPIFIFPPGWEFPWMHFEKG